MPDIRYVIKHKKTGLYICRGVTNRFLLLREGASVLVLNSIHNARKVINALIDEYADIRLRDPNGERLLDPLKEDFEIEVFNPFGNKF